MYIYIYIYIHVYIYIYIYIYIMYLAVPLARTERIQTGNPVRYIHMNGQDFSSVYQFGYVWIYTNCVFI